MSDLTGANVVLMITIPGLLTVPTQIQGFAVDDVYDTEDVTMGETLMGVDGILSAGMVFEPTPQNIALQADSPSVVIFEAWDTYEQANMVKLFAQMNATLPNLGRSYQQVQGALVRGKRLPDVKRIVQPRKWRIMWQSILAVPVGAAG